MIAPTRCERAGPSSQLVPEGIGLFQTSELVGDDVVESDTDKAALRFQHFVDATNVQVNIVRTAVNGSHRIDYLIFDGNHQSTNSFHK